MSQVPWTGRIVWESTFIAYQDSTARLLIGIAMRREAIPRTSGESMCYKLTTVCL